MTIDAGRRFEASGFSVSDDGSPRIRSGVTTRSDFSSGGQITIAASDLVYLLGGEIATDALLRAGGGGDVVINGAQFVVLNEGRILASSKSGLSGNLDITTGTLFASAPFAINPGHPFPSTGSVIDATGDITIIQTSPESELVGQAQLLPTTYMDTSALLGSVCEARTSHASSFHVIKRHAADLAPPDAALLPLGLHHAPSGVRVLPDSTDLCAQPEEDL